MNWFMDIKSPKDNTSQQSDFIGEFAGYLDDRWELQVGNPNHAPELQKIRENLRKASENAGLICRGVAYVTLVVDKRLSAWAL